MVCPHCWQHLTDCALDQHLSHKAEALSVRVKIAEGLDDGLMFLEADSYFKSDNSWYNLSFLDERKLSAALCFKESPPHAQ